MIKISPSALSADFSRLADSLSGIEKAGADLLHVDVMDGVFVPNISFGFPVIKAMRASTKLPLDVHLMIVRPDLYIDRFADAGAAYITIHAESDDDTASTLRAIRARGVKAGLSVRPNTPISEITPYLDLVDMILIMTVEPGFGGQKLIPETLEKVRQTRALIGDRPIELEVDGGVTTDNAGVLIGNGANVIVAGSAVFGAPDPAVAIAGIRKWER